MRRLQACACEMVWYGFVERTLVVFCRFSLW